ncbi:MAG: HNH endonuclease [Methylococcales bacterium]|jgi:5-methylcytosine-specific restriction endonuclease McrA|nr:HNH endonuclease [Methylococcales bacterium]
MNNAKGKREQMLEDQKGKCCYCGTKIDDQIATLDHVIPKSRGGGNGIDNLVVSCKLCNNSFADSSPKYKMLTLFEKAFI